MSEQKQQTPTGGRCPICGKSTVAASRPFCSKRCADIDLARWLSGSYVVAGGLSDADEDGDDTAAGEAQRGGQRPFPEPDADNDA
jgi:hypothetical protein